MNVFITGGTGFIGSRLALKCFERGDQVTVLGQENTDAEKQNSRELIDMGIKVVHGAVTNAQQISALVDQTDVVFHLAAAQHEANVPDKTFWDVNVTGTRNILNASAAAGVKRFVHGSTIGVYGHADAPVNENSPCNPENIYGVTKLEGEKLALSYKEKMPMVVIRVSETYGPGDRRLLKLFRAINRKAFFMIGTGQNLHQLIYVDDLIRGMLAAAESEKALGEIILLVGKTSITTAEMAETISDVLDVRLPKFHAPLWPFMIAAYVMETVLKPTGIQPPLHRRRMDFFKKSFSFNTSKALDLLSFTPQYSFEKGVEETARWYREKGLLFGENENVGLHALPGNMLIDQELAAQIEPFDTFWEAPADVEKGFAKFAKFYKRNYFKHMPSDRSARTLVISCGTGYMVEFMRNEGYTDVLGVDSDPDKIAVAKRHNLNCQTNNAFPFLKNNRRPFDLIFAEQEINHLTKTEIMDFLKLCHRNLSSGGALIVHSLNGANPITGSEALAQNVDHFNTFTDYSLTQILHGSDFHRIKTFPLNLYIFYENPLNYIGLIVDKTLNLIFRLSFIFYGKSNKIFTKKIGVIGYKM